MPPIINIRPLNLAPPRNNIANKIHLPLTIPFPCLVHKPIPSPQPIYPKTLTCLTMVTYPKEYLTLDAVIKLGIMGIHIIGFM